MTTTTKGLSASQVARRYEISRQTAHYFMQKVREAMKSSESQKMNDSVQVIIYALKGIYSFIYYSENEIEEQIRMYHSTGF